MSNVRHITHQVALLADCLFCPWSATVLQPNGTSEEEAALGVAALIAFHMQRNHSTAVDNRAV